ncbi:MAG: LLM class flavin-dependent oxidoreductase [Chloroflexaceae bacterium]|nr:LLM class flavin-dependent oxidoreductase [Chloroflexaceae bacterium]
MIETQVAEEAGFDLAVYTEHHQAADGYLPNPLLQVAAAAAVTNRIQVGSAVMLLSLHNAIQVAEDAFQLDVMSKGRLFLGVGLGVCAVGLCNVRYSLQAAQVALRRGASYFAAGHPARRIFFCGHPLRCRPHSGHPASGAAAAAGLCGGVVGCRR